MTMVMMAMLLMLQEAVTTMDDYVSLPAQRLAHLVKKYVHHSRMKEIEGLRWSSPMAFPE